MENTHRYSFIKSDIKSLSAQINTGYQGPLSDALKLLTEAHKEGGKIVANDETIRLLEVCCTMFKKAHIETPTCSVIVHRWANAEHLLGSLLSPDQQTPRYMKAFFLFDLAIKMWPNYIGALRDRVLFVTEYIKTLDATQEAKIKELQAKLEEAKIKVKELESNPMACYTL